MARLSLARLNPSVPFHPSSDIPQQQVTPMRSTHVDSSRSVSDRARRGLKDAGGGRSSRRAALRRSYALESLETRLLMHANVAEDTEHAAVFGTYVTAGGKQVLI